MSEDIGKENVEKEDTERRRRANTPRDLFYRECERALNSENAGKDASQRTPATAPKQKHKKKYCENAAGETATIENATRRKPKIEKPFWRFAVGDTEMGYGGAFGVQCAFHLSV